MLALMLTKLIILAQFLPFSGMAPSAPAHVPATQPQAVVDATAGALQKLSDTTVGKLLTGKMTVSPEKAFAFQFWADAAKDLIVAAIGFIPRLLVACLFLLIFYAIYRGVRRIVLGSLTKAHVDSSIRDMLGSLLRWGIMGFGLVIACNQIGIQITALLTGVSIIGLAIGFAAQETLANFIAGIVIFWDKPFKVGDWIDIDTKYGRVLRITFRSTRMLNLDGEVLVMPNTMVLANKLINHSTNSLTRVNVLASIAYKDSIDDARSALLALTTHDSRICKDPPPGVVVTECADSSVNLQLRFWITDESTEKAVFHEFTEKAKKALDAAGFDNPFPHLQLFIEDTPIMQALANMTGTRRKAG